MKVDISSWDARTRRMLKIYPLDDGRAQHWLMNYGGDMRQVQLEYLRHYGGEVFNTAYSEFNGLKYAEEGRLIDSLDYTLKMFKRARIMYQTWDDLTNNEPWGLPIERLKACDKKIKECREKIGFLKIGPGGI
ncbi:MAG: hypothetical protein V1731_02280 [Candidatus Aenigmatarchaeota archaeon]